MRDVHTARLLRGTGCAEGLVGACVPQSRHPHEVVGTDGVRRGGLLEELLIAFRVSRSDLAAGGEGGGEGVRHA
ncbi:hypothetical protein, partial [Streptomyces sp. NPDC053726]|uniref:hypothetical protein n=1 Tax=Streptomyces sp. NPDC053726 TaxID=3365713 RepID=UPI0037D3754B